MDKKNKPQVIQEKSLTMLKVKQTAAEMWSFLRLLPFFIAEYIPGNNNVWENYILFLDILNRLCASKFCDSDLIILHQLINDFFVEYLKLYPDQDLKPKAHFIKHYPAMIRKFGPLFKTLRFESKNGQMKLFTANNKNRKDLCFSLAKKHQMLMYLTYKKHFMLEHDNVKAIGSVETSLLCLCDSEKESIIGLVGCSEDELLIEARAAIFEGQRYSTGEAVLLTFLHDEYVFGEILKVFIISNNVYLMCNVLITEHYNCRLHAYEVKETISNKVVSLTSLLDYHPLAVYKVGGVSYVVMRYYVPV